MGSAERRQVLPGRVRARVVPLPPPPTHPPGRLPRLPPSPSFTAIHQPSPYFNRHQPTFPPGKPTCQHPAKEIQSVSFSASSASQLSLLRSTLARSGDLLAVLGPGTRHGRPLASTTARRARTRGCAAIPWRWRPPFVRRIFPGGRVRVGADLIQISFWSRPGCVAPRGGSSLSAPPGHRARDHRRISRPRYHSCALSQHAVISSWRCVSRVLIPTPPRGYGWISGRPARSGLRRPRHG